MPTLAAAVIAALTTSADPSHASLAAHFAQRIGLGRTAPMQGGGVRWRIRPEGLRRTRLLDRPVGAEDGPVDPDFQIWAYDIWSARAAHTHPLLVFVDLVGRVRREIRSGALSFLPVPSYMKVSVKQLDGGAFVTLRMSL